MIQLQFGFYNMCLYLGGSSHHVASLYTGMLLPGATRPSTDINNNNNSKPEGTPLIVAHCSLARPTVISLSRPSLSSRPDVNIPSDTNEHVKHVFLEIIVKLKPVNWFHSSAAVQNTDCFSRNCPSHDFAVVFTQKCTELFFVAF